jgi:hypothetical protein
MRGFADWLRRTNPDLERAVEEFSKEPPGKPGIQVVQMHPLLMTEDK